MFRKNHEPEEEPVPIEPGYTSNIQVRKRNVSVIGSHAGVQRRIVRQ